MNDSRRVAALVGFTFALLPIVFASVLAGDASPPVSTVVEISVGECAGEVQAQAGIDDGCPGSVDARTNIDD